MNFDQMKQYLIEAATRAGLSEYEIYARADREISTEALKHEISGFSSGLSGGISFRCIVNGRMGYASSEYLTKAEMDSLVDRAVDNAKSIENDDEVEIFRGSPHYEEAGTVPALPDAATLKKWALELHEQTYARHESVADGTQSGAVAFESEILLCNSHGLELCSHVGSCGAYVEAVVKQGDEAVSEFKIATLEDESALSSLATAAVEGARAKLGATTLASGNMDCVISGRQMKQLLSVFFPMFSAQRVQYGMSLLKGRIGQRIASDVVTVTDDPRREQCAIKASFDGEGVATTRKSVIDKGVLCTYLYDLKTAKKDGVPSTGNGQRASYTSPVSIAPYCFCLEARDQTLEELIGKVKDGVYITELKGLHAGADAVTGDFSLESAGFRIRDGRIAEPVRSFTIAGNFLTLLESIEAVSDTVDFGFSGGFTTYASADVLLRGMSIAGD